jgi:hypothetical protein
MCIRIRIQTANWLHNHVVTDPCPNFYLFEAIWKRTLCCWLHLEVTWRKHTDDHDQLIWFSQAVSLNKILINNNHKTCRKSSAIFTILYWF